MHRPMCFSVLRITNARFQAFLHYRIYSILLADLDCEAHLIIGHLNLYAYQHVSHLIGNPGINDVYTTTTAFCSS